MGTAARAILAVFCVLVATPCSEGLGAATSANPQETFQWRADSGAQVSLVPVLDAANAGWCMQTLTETVTATETVRGRACLQPPTSTGPVLAETCDGRVGEKGAIVFALTQSDVASVSIAGGAQIPTTTNATLPDGLRTVSLQAPEYILTRGFFQEHCPAVSAFDASGNLIPMHPGRGFPLAARLLRRTWAHPGRPPRGVCELTATKLRRGTVAWEGAVATKLGPVPGLLGQALLSCASTVYVHSGGHYITAAILLNASHPGATPPPLPGMKPLPQHPGIFEAQSSAGQTVARRIPGAWLLATEETPTGLAVPTELLENLRATIHL
jgi:hypothetical protein